MTPSPIRDIHVSASLLISVGQSLLVWDTVNGIPRANFICAGQSFGIEGGDGQLNKVVLLDDGDTIVTSGIGGLSVFSIAERRKIRLISLDNVANDLIDNGDKSVLAYQRGNLGIWDVDSGEQTWIKPVRSSEFVGGTSRAAVKGRRLAICTGSESLGIASGESWDNWDMLLKVEDAQPQRSYLNVGVAEDMVVGVSACGRVDLFDFND
jgi:hypothetical protein